MENNNTYEIMDSCYATVTGSCYAGAFLTLDNGQQAFAYGLANLLPGTKTLCTVLKYAKENRRMLVSVDSVIEYAVAAA